MNLTNASAKLFLSSILATFVSTLGIIYFSKRIGAAGLGLYFIYVTLVSLSYFISDLGINKSVEKRISQGEPRAETIGSAVLIKGLLLLCSSIGLFLIDDHVNSYAGGPITRLLILGIIVQQFDSLIQSILRSDHRVGETADLQVIRQLVWITVGVLLIADGWGALGVIVASLCGNLAAIAIGLLKLDRSIAFPSLAQIRSLFSFSKYAFISQTSGKLYNWIDIFILGFFVSNALIGAYEGAWQISGIALLISRSISTALFPEVSSWSSEESAKRIANLLSRYITPVVFLTIPAVFGSFLLGEALLVAVYTPEFGVAAFVLIIFMVEKVIHSVHLLFGQIIQGMNRPEVTAKASVISIIINILGNILLIPAYGIEGAAIATSASHIINTTLLYLYVKKVWAVKIPVKEIVWCIVASVLMSISIYIGLDLNSIRSMPEVFVAIAFGAIVYLVISLGYRPLRRQAFDTLTSFVST
ncbi:polysaccharide biosynthesis C-terminal domain-containing protein [Halomontanus rarus]|uniref:oligosaccharide flippase family protein n=1 Tax=Halomontanus rarus TaxID=3034020 RepID=UPI001A99CB56